MKIIANIFAALSLAIAAQAATAQAWPSKPIRVVITFPPGGTSDIVGRLVGDRLGPRLGQPLVMENRPGVAGILGTEAVVKSPPDGYTLLLTSTAPIAFAPSRLRPGNRKPGENLSRSGQ